MRRTADNTPLSAQPRRLTALHSLSAGPSPPADPAAPASASPPKATQMHPLLSAPEAAPLRSLPPLLRTLPPTLARRPATSPAFLVPAPLPARVTRDQAAARTAGSVAAAGAAAGLAKTLVAYQAISPAHPPSHSPRSAVRLLPPLHAQAFRAAAQAQAPGPSRMKPAAPHRIAPAPSPAELAQLRKKEEAAENMKAAVTMVDKIEAAGYATVPQVCRMHV